MKCKKNILNLLKDLISFKSYQCESADILNYISDLLVRKGFICDIQKFGEEKIHNLYAYYKRDEGTNICFAGHADVVGIADYSKWLTNPFCLEILDNKAFGRGVVDMKAALACSICAALEIIEISTRCNVSFLITGDEEGRAEFGTKKMISYVIEKYPRIDLCILGEPTSESQIGDFVKIGRRGSINFYVEIYGKEGHVAYPEHAKDSIKSAVRIAVDLINYNFNDSTNLVISNLGTNNIDNNVIAGKSWLEFNIRFSHNFVQESLEKIVQSIIEKHSSIFTIKSHCNAFPFYQNTSKEMLDFIKVINKTTGIQSKMSNLGGTSDARFISQYIPVIELGLSCKQAHKENEHAPLEDIQKLYDIYFQYLKYVFI